MILGTNGQDTVQNCYLGFGENGGIVPLVNSVGMVVGGSNNTIGGTMAGQSNVIANNASGGANGAIGLEIPSGSVHNQILGNYIGTDFSGTSAYPNIGSGVVVSGSFTIGNRIGGTIADPTVPMNLISGNQQSGIAITSQATRTLVQGNFIGTDLTGSQPLGNSGNGVTISSSANDNTIGGTTPDAGNTIAMNHQDGVRIDASTSDAIFGNAIFANGSFNINLPNGGNNSQVPPLLTAATSDQTQTTITGTLIGSPQTTFLLQFYSGTSASPPEGRHFLGSATVTTDGSGRVNFTITLPIGVGQDQFITATATDPGTNTSQFSRSVAVDPTRP